MTSISLSTSWENGLIDKLDQLHKINNKGRVIEIYGSFPFTLVGSGRAGDKLPQVDKNKFENHIQYARKKNIGFNYTINAPELDGLENDLTWVNNLHEHLQYLKDLGINRLTICNSFIIKFVIEKFPNFKINLSLIKGVDTAKKAIEYDNMGIDVITLNPHTINRDFDRLQEIRNAVKCKLELYANIPCIHNCPVRDEHYAYLGRVSRENNKSKSLIDKYSNWCSLSYLTNPIEFIKTPFIRPEDISEYENIGIDIFKLTDRDEPASYLFNAAKSYLEKRYDDNLLYLIFKNGNKIKRAFKPIFNDIEKFSFPIYIDNKKLSEYDFINNIKKLKGEELENYYNHIFSESITGYDHEDIKIILSKMKFSSTHLNTLNI